MFYYPSAKAILKAWAQNLGIQIGPIGARLNEPADAIARVQANMQQLVTAISNVEAARLELDRLMAVLDEVEKKVGPDTRGYIKRLKTNPLFTDVDGHNLQVISTTAIADLTGYQPTLIIKESGGKFHMTFRKHGADGMNIYTRLQGQAEWILLANAKVTPYIYLWLLAVAGVAEIREFCAMPTLANTEVGKRSNIVTMKFAG